MTDSAEVRALLVDDVTLSELSIRPNALELQIDRLRGFATQSHRLMKIGRGDEGAKRHPQIRQQTEIEWSRLVVLLANGEGPRCSVFISTHRHERSRQQAWALVRTDRRTSLDQIRFPPACGVSTGSILFLTVRAERN
jgi:hypothetical protein